MKNKTKAFILAIWIGKNQSLSTAQAHIIIKVKKKGECHYGESF